MVTHRTVYFSDVIPPSTQTFDLKKLTAQQRALNKQGKLHWVHWLIAGLTLFITIIAWKTSESALAKQEYIQFEREADRVVSLMSERIEHYNDALISGVAAISVQQGEMTREQWHHYANHLDLTNRYPGANGIGVIHYVDTQNIAEYLSNARIDKPDFSIHPEHPYELSLPIIYIEPYESNAAAIGLDIAFETNRRSSALYARSTGMSQISGPIVLIQDEGKTPGFLFYAPYYDGDTDETSEWTNEQREQHFRGLIYAPVVVKNLVEGVLSAKQRSVTLSIRDGDVVLHDESEVETDGVYSRSQEIELYGRNWTFDIANQPSVTGARNIDQPAIVLLSGLLLDGMLFGLFWLMSRTNQRTLSLAKSMTDTLTTQAQTLSDKNSDLESFAHVASHDLKAPIRNIQTLIGVIDEDFANYLASNDEGMEIKETLDMIAKQAGRGQNLINGILDYSKVGAAMEQLETIDTRKLVQSIGLQLNLSENQLRLSGSFPTLTTHVTLLEQIFSNLIGNAIKFNPDANPATVDVSVSLKTDAHYCFTVTDNGPGIEARFHERIFEQFASLNTNPDIQSSGIGLSIVQRALELQGCSISIDSAPGEGATFEFTWPTEHTERNQQENRRYA